MEQGRWIQVVRFLPQTLLRVNQERDSLKKSDCWRKKVWKWSDYALKVCISLKWEEMTTENGNIEYEFNDTLIVLKICCKNRAKVKL